MQGGFYENEEDVGLGGCGLLRDEQHNSNEDSGGESGGGLHWCRVGGGGEIGSPARLFIYFCFKGANYEKTRMRLLF